MSKMRRRCYGCGATNRELRAVTFYEPTNHQTLYVCERCNAIAVAMAERDTGKGVEKLGGREWSDMPVVPLD